MPICAYPDCNEFCMLKSNVCSTHKHVNANEIRKEKERLQALRLREETEHLKQEERNKLGQKKAEQERNRKQFQSNFIREHRRRWNDLIDGVVDEVLKLRETDKSANAGNNKSGKTTKGGTNNPIYLAMTGQSFGVRKGDILNEMSGWDNSDSGVFKFRRKGVLVHCY